MTTRGLTDDSSPVGLVTLWAAFWAGPFGWAFNQLVGYAVVRPVCAGAATYVLWGIAAAAFAIAAVGAWTGWRCVRLLRATAADDGGAVQDRSYFLASL